MIKAVLFDLDGTLLDTNRLILESFKYTFKKHLNINVNDEEIIKYFGEPLKTTLERYSREKLQDMFETYIKFNFDKHDEMTTIMDGVEETLKQLNEIGVKTAVVTSKREVMARKGLKLFNIEKYFETVITPEMTNSHKPDPDPIYKACENLSISPIDAIMVGDSSFDILCGKNAGSKTCLVNYTLLDKNEINKYKPDYSVNKIEDLVDIVKCF